MADKKRTVPRGGKPARRPLRHGGTAEGYQLDGVFVPFESYSASDFIGAGYADSTVQCETTSSTSSYDGGASYGSSDSGSYSGGSDSSSYSGGSDY